MCIAVASRNGPESARAGYCKSAHSPLGPEKGARKAQTCCVTARGMMARAAALGHAHSLTKIQGGIFLIIKKFQIMGKMSRKSRDSILILCNFSMTCRCCPVHTRFEMGEWSPGRGGRGQAREIRMARRPSRRGSRRVGVHRRQRSLEANGAGRRRLWPDLPLDR